MTPETSLVKAMWALGNSNNADELKTFNARKYCFRVLIMAEIEVLRIGQGVVRDDRVTTHVALVARSFGAQKIYMNEVNPEIKHTIFQHYKTWGGDFEIEIISEWKKVIKEKKKAAVKIVHLTMYGQNINNVETQNTK